MDDIEKAELEVLGITLPETTISIQEITYKEFREKFPLTKNPNAKDQKEYFSVNSLDYIKKNIPKSEKRIWMILDVLEQDLRIINSTDLNNCKEIAGITIPIARGFQVCMGFFVSEDEYQEGDHYSVIYPMY